LAALIALLIVTNVPFQYRNENKIFTLPGLPRPIAKVPVVITSAGQSTDSYIVRDISNQLMIRSFFMPQARDVDIKDIKTIVFVVGYSSLGAKLQSISYEDEKIRIEKLLEKAKDNKLTVLTIAIGREQPHDNKTEELLRLIGKQTDYLIGMRASRSESIMAELARDRDIPLTLVNEVNDISEPFASAFR
ncbi:MAG: DUF6305 family protein, partial [Clostridia bacterium]